MSFEAFCYVVFDLHTGQPVQYIEPDNGRPSRIDICSLCQLLMEAPSGAQDFVLNAGEYLLVAQQPRQSVMVVAVAKPGSSSGETLFELQLLSFLAITCAKCKGLSNRKQQQGVCPQESCSYAQSRHSLDQLTMPVVRQHLELVLDSLRPAAEANTVTSVQLARFDLLGELTKVLTLTFRAAKVCAQTKPCLVDAVDAACKLLMYQMQADEAAAWSSEAQHCKQPLQKLQGASNCKSSFATVCIQEAHGQPWLAAVKSVYVSSTYMFIIAWVCSTSLDEEYSLNHGSAFSSQPHVSVGKGALPVAIASSLSIAASLLKQAMHVT